MIVKSKPLKRVLLILYYWPPSGGAGVHRWLKFVKYLPDFGWKPIVYVPSNPDYPLLDSRRLEEVPEGLEILRHPIWEPFSLYRKFTGKSQESLMDFGHLVNAGTYIEKGWRERLAIWIRGNIFIPDSRVFWTRPSVRFLEAYHRDHPFDAIITSGPPHSLHLTGLALKKRTGLPWLADFRDPWSEYFNSLMLSGFARNLHAKLEKNVLQAADKVVVIGRFMQQKHLESAGIQSELVMNGFDPEDYETTPKPIPDRAKLTLLYAGTLSRRRNCQAFWKALHTLVNEQPAFAEVIDVHIIGKADATVFAEIAAHNLEAYVRFTDFIPFQEVLFEQMHAGVLLLFVDNFEGAPWVLTGKFFEYLASNRPILALGPRGGDLEVELENTASGLFADFNDPGNIQTALWTFFNQYRDGSLFDYQNINTGKYSRKYLTSLIASFLNQIT